MAVSLVLISHILFMSSSQFERGLDLLWHINLVFEVCF